MARMSVGYDGLVREYNIPARPLPVRSVIDTGINARKVESRQDGTTVQLFSPHYFKGQSFGSNLKFALRYEGINIEVLAFQRKTNSILFRGISPLLQKMVAEPAALFKLPVQDSFLIMSGYSRYFACRQS